MAGANPLARLPGLADDLARVEEELLAAVRSENTLLTDISSHLIAAGGKRVRPGFCLAAAATGVMTPGPSSKEAVLGGVSVELVHLGSLYHDDVMDDALMRRTVESVNARWGNLKAILAGDFLLARASEIAAGLGTEVSALLAATIGRLCEGQILELEYTYRPDRTEDLYLRSIQGKTAALLAAACRIGGLVGGLPRDRIDALTTFGRCYGMAFQIVDDVLDLVSTEDRLGKPVGHDLVEGVYTLPVLRTLARDGEGDQLRPLLGDRIDGEPLDRALALVRTNGTIEESIAVARGFAAEARDALSGFPPSPGLDALNAASEHLIESVAAASAAA